ncbi:MAG TPA: hypothetical protein VGJ51_05120 [Candidatus Angelobacter sp.]
MRLTYSSAHRYLTRRPTQSLCLSVPFAASRPASLVSIAKSNSAPTIFIPALTVATSIAVIALTLTTPMVTGLILTRLSSSPRHKVQFAHYPSTLPISGIPPPHKA